MLATSHHPNRYRYPHSPLTPTMNAASLRASNSMNRSRSARNVMARTLPILERGGSVRNFRELPADRRRGNANLLESPGSARNLQAYRRRSNSTRRFFVADQGSRGSTASASATASSLSNHFQRMNLDRQDSASSMGSFQSFGANSSMCSGTANNSNNDSVLSILSIDSNLSLICRSPAAPSSLSTSTHTHAELETDAESMMSLFSKDSVRVRHSQMESLGSTHMQAPCRDDMSVIADDDMFSVASSECTVYSFDVCGPSAFGSLLNGSPGHSSAWA